jgi:hypothetical protein
MKKIIAAIACVLLSACSDHYAEHIDTGYVKDCNDKGGRVERIDYSDTLQCVGVQNKEVTK